MAFYRFELRSQLSAQETLERLRGLVRAQSGFWQSLRDSFGIRLEDGLPFIGSIDGNDFKVRRDIRYRNSFLPSIRGRVIPTPEGATVAVTMHLHPVVIVLMSFWLGAVGSGAWAMFVRGKTIEALPLCGMFVFGLALTFGGFYPEAFKARRILEANLGKATQTGRNATDG